MSSTTPGTLNFHIKVLRGVPSIPKGTYAAELTTECLRLRSAKTKQIVAEIRPNNRVQNRTANTLTLNFESELITLQPLKLNGYPDLITNAVERVLNGNSTSFRASDYEIPRLLMLVAAVPISLAAIGGLAGGSMGGAATGLNLFIARKHSWPLLARIGSMFALTLVAFALYFLAVRSFGSVPTQPQIAQAPLTATPTNPTVVQPEIPPPPKPAAIEALTSTGIFQLQSPSSDITAAIVRDDCASILVACQDGTLQTLSLLDPTPTWKLVAKLPSVPHTIRKLTADYYLITCPAEKLLLTPNYKLLRLSWKWECIPSTSYLCVANDTNIKLGAVNFGAIERAADTSNNGLGNLPLTTLPMDFLESKDGPALSIALPPQLSLSNITTSGMNPIGFGFRDGTIAIKASGEWSLEKSRSAAVTCLGSGNGFGFEDGTVDTGLLDEKLRYRSCGDAPIQRLISLQVWTLAINQKGECWSFISQDPAAPQKKLPASEFGTIRDIAPLDYAIAIVSQNQVTFMSSPKLTSLLK